MFEKRRPATPEEIAALISSFDVIGDPPAVLYEAEISAIATLDQLGAAFTVLAVVQPAPDQPRFYTLAACAASWNAGGGSEHDRESYRRALGQAEDPAFTPEILFAPTALVPSGWWIVDAIHRGAGLLTKRRARSDRSGLRVYVLPRPL